MHSAQPKYWRNIDRLLTNYTPLSFDYRIENLTPTADRGLWFSVGSAIQRIDSDGGMTQFVMPHDLWRVSGITQVGSDIWFSAGQSGKVGKLGAQGRLTFVQVVPRRFFPDIHEIVVKGDGQMWFLDEGRRSIGYRSASGRVVENPIRDADYILRMRHCMGRLWLVVRTPTASRLEVVDGDLRARWYTSAIPKRSMINDLACDAHDNLWLTLQNRFPSSLSFAARLNSRGHLKMFALERSAAITIAPDTDGGIWVSLFRNPYAFGLMHVDKNGERRTYDLPTGPYGATALAVAGDGTLWLGIGNGNSPLSVASLRSLKR